jgi:TRAP-type transport system small permease protein
MKHINRFVGRIGGLIIALIMVMTVTQVVSRSLFGVSLESSIEMIGLLLALSVFLGLSPCEENDAHIKVDIVTMRLPRRVMVVLECFVYFIALLTALTITYQIGKETVIAWQTMESIPGSGIRLPTYPAKLVSFFGFLLFDIQLTISFLTRVLRKKPKHR